MHVNVITQNNPVIFKFPFWETCLWCLVYSSIKQHAVTCKHLIPFILVCVAWANSDSFGIMNTFLPLLHYRNSPWKQEPGTHSHVSTGCNQSLFLPHGVNPWLPKWPLQLRLSSSSSWGLLEWRFSAELPWLDNASNMKAAPPPPKNKIKEQAYEYIKKKKSSMLRPGTNERKTYSSSPCHSRPLLLSLKVFSSF